MKLLLPDAVTASDPGPLSALEERLHGADAAQAREETQSLLADLERRARAGMSAGAAPDRYRELAALLDASLAAQEALAHFSPTPPPAGSHLSHLGQERK
ncbi:hypothetical protein [Acidovorax sp. CCYZU-2555]|uniref:hypothetical protein n=1 Tax=Acidovorax sp. CCYZU-2555 TaxID=2835042 RepID=UPI001BCE616D|nr:hypothetical protein [Acidovorax sp. CCYZU-2555]MBS7777608.1 hypothetical protein [Acidovorax sp. CCYZU-2555]